MNTLKRALAVLPAVVLFGTPVAAQGQTYHMPTTPTTGVWLEASHADLEDFDQSVPSTVWFLSGRMPLTNRLSVVADVPFTYSRVTFEQGLEESSSVLGNPFLGVEYGMRSLTLETGVRLPLNTIDEDSFADVIGFLGEFQRGEAFQEDVVPVLGAVSYERGLSRGVTLRGRAGVVGLFETGDDDGVDNEALVDYGVLGTVPAGIWRFGLGMYGRWAATQDHGSFGENSIHHLALSGDVRIKRVRPGLSVRIPVDGAYNDVLNSTIGLYVQVPLR